MADRLGPEQRPEGPRIAYRLGVAVVIEVDEHVVVGPVGACMATSGPGAIQLLNGLHDAKLDHVIPHLRPQDDRSWREDIEAGVARW
jgi:hypothetical protein